MSFSPINLCIGTYDGTVAGLELTEDETSALALKTIFAATTHASTVRSAALRGSTLVTGGADEVIRIYDFSRRVEVGTLLHHNGTVNALKFAHDHGRNLLFSAGADAAICVWRTADWKLLKRLTGHQAGVSDIAIHPSATVALSVSRDRSLFVWNLARGKISFSAKTKNHPASCVEWSPDGSKYSLCAATNVNLSTIDGRSARTFAHAKNVLCTTFLSNDVVATGGEECVVRLWDARANEGNTSAISHDARVRDIAFVDNLLFSTDSSGGLKIWDCRKGGEPRIETTIAANARITSMTAASQVWTPPGVFNDSPVMENDDGKTSVKDESKRKLSVQPISKRNGLSKTGDTASQRKRKKRKLRSR